MSGGLTNYRYVHKGMLRELARLEAMAQELDEASLAEQGRPFRRAARFAQAMIKNHALGEERVIFPALKALFRKALPPGISRLPKLAGDFEEAAGSVQALVEADHRAAEELAGQLAAAAVRLMETEDAAERASLLRSSLRQAIALHAILSRHFQKENDLLLPLAQSRLSSQEQDDLMRQVEQALPLSDEQRADSIRRWWRALTPEEQADYRANLMRMGRWPGDDYVARE